MYSGYYIFTRMPTVIVPCICLQSVIFVEGSLCRQFISIHPYRFLRTLTSRCSYPYGPHGSPLAMALQAGEPQSFPSTFRTQNRAGRPCGLPDGSQDTTPTYHTGKLFRRTYCSWFYGRACQDYGRTCDMHGHSGRMHKHTASGNIRPYILTEACPLHRAIQYACRWAVVKSRRILP